MGQGSGAGALMELLCVLGLERLEGAGDLPCFWIGLGIWMVSWTYLLSCRWIWRFWIGLGMVWMGLGIGGGRMAFEGIQEKRELMEYKIH